MLLRTWAQRLGGGLYSAQATPRTTYSTLMLVSVLGVLCLMTLYTSTLWYVNMRVRFTLSQDAPDFDLSGSRDQAPRSSLFPSFSPSLSTLPAHRSLFFPNSLDHALLSRSP